MTSAPLLPASTVLELATEIAGPYCTKMLADAGADVVKLEPPGGDPLRRWSASRRDLGGEDGVLFRFLGAGKRSVSAPTAAAWRDELARLAPGARLIVESGQLDAGEIAVLRARHPHLSIVSISPCGTANPWSRRPWTEFTLQALCGSIAGRGDPDREPFYAAGRLGEWAAGAYAAVAAAALLLQSHRTGASDHADVSMVAAMTMTMTSYRSLRKRLVPAGTYDNSRSLDVPSIEPTKNGYIGFAFATRQQFSDLLAMIDRTDLIDDDHLASTFGRRQRKAEFLGLLRAWTTQHTSEEIVELATAFRVPVALISEPQTILQQDHFVERGVFVPSADGSFVQPRRPYRVDDAAPPAVAPAPRLGVHTGAVDWPPLDGPASAPGRPLRGVRVVDLTAFWAGPSSSQALALLGADVIKVESVQRPDGMRFTGCRPRTEPDWWEHGYFFQGVNTDKRAVTLDLTSETGRSLLLDLVRTADVVMENFTPRVLDSFGLGPEVLHRANPALVVTRMPGFGLDGPWRDRPGFAQNMEQASGLAWITGFPDGPPCTVPGLCDPVAGMHAAFATIAALAERDHSGRGHVLEASMIETALNVAAEMVLEQSAYGASLRRAGNRGPAAAPQGVYRAAGAVERFVALAVRDDADWRRLVTLDGLADLRDPRFTTDVARREHADAIDAVLGAWVRAHDADELAERLAQAGVPASVVVSGEDVMELDALRGSGFVETFDHPIVGRHEVYVLPFRLASRPGQWIEHAAPRLGQHNDEVLGGLLGLGASELEDLRARKVIGERPLGT